MRRHAYAQIWACAFTRVAEGRRGGPNSADHVDILSNVDLISDVLTIAAGHGDKLDDVIISEIRSIADNIPYGAE